MNDDEESGHPKFEEADVNITNDYNTESIFIFSELKKKQGELIVRKASQDLKYKKKISNVIDPTVCICE